MTQFSIHSPKHLGWLKRLAEKAPDTAPWVELGVLEGGSAEAIYEAAQARGVKLHLFDTFNGQPSYESTVDPHRFGHQRSETDEYGIRHHMPAAEVHVGVFPEIIDYCDDQLQKVGFVHIDFACYAGTYEAGRIFLPRLVDGGIMVFSGHDTNEAVKAAITAIGVAPDERGVYRNANSPPLRPIEALPSGNFSHRRHAKKLHLTPRSQRALNDLAP